MAATNVGKAVIIFIHMLAGWALCGVVMGIGRKVTTLDTALVIHAAAVPIIFGAISFIYHRKFNFTAPLATGMIFTLFAMAMDAALVAPLFEKSYEMFTSVPGTWVPFGLIALSTAIVGTLVNRRSA